MTFAPSVSILSRQPGELARPDLSLDAVLRHFPGVAHAEALGFTGSAAVGWGNAYSDVDLYAFSDEELTLPIDETMEMWPGSDPSGITWTTWMGRYGDTRVDLRVWPTTTLDRALEPFLASPEPEFCGAGDFIEDFVYRVRVAQPLANPAFFERMRGLIDDSSYRRALARTLKAHAENSLTDVAGQLGNGDDVSARLSALKAAAKTADMCLVIAGELCRRGKWLMRRIEETPSCGITPGEYRAAVLQGAAPGESERDCALRVARWAQSHLVRTEDIVLETR